MSKILLLKRELEFIKYNALCSQPHGISLNDLRSSLGLLFI